MKNGRIREVVMPPIENKFTAPIRWAKSWNELGNIFGSYVDNFSQIYEGCTYKNCIESKNTFATKEQAIQYGIVAAQLSQLVANLNGEPNWKSSDSAFKHYYYCIIMNNRGDLCIERNPLVVFPFPIKTKEAAEFSLKNHADLWRKFHGLS